MSFLGKTSSAALAAAIAAQKKAAETAVKPGAVQTAAAPTYASAQPAAFAPVHKRTYTPLGDPRAPYTNTGLDRTGVGSGTAVGRAVERGV